MIVKSDSLYCGLRIILVYPNPQWREAYLTLTYRLWGIVWIVFISPFSRQCQNLCLRSLAFITDWRVVRTDCVVVSLHSVRCCTSTGACCCWWICILKGPWERGWLLHITDTLVLRPRLIVCATSSDRLDIQPTTTKSRGSPWRIILTVISRAYQNSEIQYKPGPKFWLSFPDFT